MKPSDAALKLGEPWKLKALPPGHAEALETVCAELSTKEERAAFLAQACWETGGFRQFAESLAFAAKHYEGRHDLGNLQQGDGGKFRGRGAFHLTGRANYAAFSAYAKEPQLMDNPDRVADEPALGWGSALWYWRKEALGSALAKGGIDLVSRRINGGDNGRKERRELYEKALKLL